MDQAKILVVDEEPAIRELLVDALTPQGYLVFAASDGVSALEIASREAPDIAFLDIRAPGVSGLELLARLKEISSGVQAVMLTCRTWDEAVDSALRMGAGACLTKPFGASEAVEMVQIMQLVS